MCPSAFIPTPAHFHTVLGYFDLTLTLPRLPKNLVSEGGVNIQQARINYRVFGGPRLG